MRGGFLVRARTRRLVFLIPQCLQGRFRRNRHRDARSRRPCNVDSTGEGKIFSKLFNIFAVSNYKCKSHITISLFKTQLEVLPEPAGLGSVLALLRCHSRLPVSSGELFRNRRARRSLDCLCADFATASRRIRTAAGPSRHLRAAPFASCYGVDVAKAGQLGQRHIELIQDAP